MKCKNCRNAKLVETARYCPDCGYPLDEKFNVTPEDFLRDTEDLGLTELLSPDSGEPLRKLKHQEREYLWDPEGMGVWVGKENLSAVDPEAAQIVFENLNPDDQKYLSQAKENIKLRASGMKSPVTGNELDEHYYKALVFDQDFESGGLWIDPSVVSFWYAATQNKEAPALTQVEELLHILVHLRFFED